MSFLVVLVQRRENLTATREEKEVNRADVGSGSETTNSFELSFHEFEILLNGLSLARNGPVSRFEKHSGSLHLGHGTGLARLHLSNTG